MAGRIQTRLCMVLAVALARSVFGSGTVANCTQAALKAAMAGGGTLEGWESCYRRDYLLAKPIECSGGRRWELLCGGDEYFRQCDESGCSARRRKFDDAMALVEATEVDLADGMGLTHA